MCGRAYQTFTDEELYLRYNNLRLHRNPLTFKANYNFAPTQLAPVLFVLKDVIQLDLFRWGLIPFWAKDIKSASKYSLINARGEEILEKRSYKDAFLKRRCVIPLSGFIEWRRTSPKSKQPFAIHMKGQSIMNVAGVWESWTDKETGEIVNSFSVITVAANNFMAEIHDRMPVILSNDQLADWLDATNADGKSLMDFVRPCPDNWLDAYEVSSEINSARNNKPELLLPLAK